MKNIIMLITAFLLCSSCVVNKQAKDNNLNSAKAPANNSNYVPLAKLNGDTLQYLETNFLEQKTFYVGKELNALLEDLELDIKLVYPSNSANDTSKSLGLSLNFYNQDEKARKYLQKKNPLVLTIEWENPLPSEDVSYFVRKNHLAWTEDERNYFGQFKIKDIGMVVPDY